MRDITDIKRTEEELKIAMTKAESANKAKSDFIANMSHEFRTPMNSILGFTDILKEKLHDHPEYRSYLEGVHKSGKSLLTLINDIFDISKVETGRANINPEPINLHEIDRIVARITKTPLLFRERGWGKGRLMWIQDHGPSEGLIDFPTYRENPF